MDAYIKTIAGVHKTESEDCVVANNVMIAEAFAQITDLRDIIAVADGVGGHLGGKTAAGQVCKSGWTGKRSPTFMWDWSACGSPIRERDTCERCWKWHFRRETVLESR